MPDSTFDFITGYNTSMIFERFNKIQKILLNGISQMIRKQAETREILQSFDDPDKLLIYIDGKKATKKALEIVFRNDPVFNAILSVFERNRHKLVCPVCGKRLSIRGYVIRKIITLDGILYIPVPKVGCTNHACSQVNSVDYVVPEFVIGYCAFHADEVMLIIDCDQQKQLYRNLQFRESSIIDVATVIGFERDIIKEAPPSKEPQATELFKALHIFRINNKSSISINTD